MLLHRSRRLEAATGRAGRELLLIVEVLVVARHAICLLDRRAVATVGESRRHRGHLHRLVLEEAVRVGGLRVARLLKVLGVGARGAKVIR